MRFIKIHIFASAALLSGCAVSPEPVVPLTTPQIETTRTDHGIETAQRALPTKVDAARQPAHYQHVYVDSLSEASESLKTLSLADAVANDVLSSNNLKIQQLNLDNSKLKWIVLDRSAMRPSEIEAVGGYGIEKENLSEVNFELNQTGIINPERLDKLIQKAQKVSGVFYVVGYADESGLEAKNYLLSQERSASVSAYLISHNVNPSRIHSSGAGVSHLYQELNQNRRASVSFLIENLKK